MLSGSRDSVHAVPTSGKRPIAVSGMAKRYFSPATRCVPNRLMPTPDPITGPSMSEIVGLEKHSSSQLSAYSSANARRARAPVLASPAHHLAHVAAGRERLLARRLDDDAIGLRLARKAREGLGELGPHRRRERIERARAVERDDRQRAARLDRAPRRPPAPRNHPPSSALLSRRLAQLCSRRLISYRTASSIGPIWTYTLRPIATKLARLIRQVPGRKARAPALSRRWRRDDAAIRSWLGDCARRPPRHGDSADRRNRHRRQRSPSPKSRAAATTRRKRPRRRNR